MDFMGPGETDYEGSEAVPATAVSVAQWARAQALRALLSLPISDTWNAYAAAAEVNMYAELIVTGALPSDD